MDTVHGGRHDAAMLGDLRGCAIGWVAAAIVMMLSLAGCGGTPAPPASFDPDAVPEAYARSTAALFHPGASRAFQIMPNGDLYNGAWRVRLFPSAGADTAASPSRVAYEDRWLPVAHWSRRAGAMRWDFAAIAAAAGGPRDSNLVVSLLVTAVNTGTSAAEAQLRADLAPPPDSAAFVAFDAHDLSSRAPRWGAGRSDLPVEGWAQDATIDGPTLSVRWSLGPNERRTARLVLPAYPLPERDLAAWARTSHERRVAEVRAFWRATLDEGTRLALGDPDVEAATRAARVTLLACRERRGEAWVPIANPFQYRDVWLRDGARATQALAAWGHTREAREVASGLMLFQWPTGTFLSQRGQLDGFGQSLWALEQAYLRPAAAREGLLPPADAGVRAWRWCEEQRAFGAASEWPYASMLPYGEPRDAELVRAQIVGNDAWAIAGYRSAARLARAVGRGALADSIDASRQRYALDFEAALERTGTADVPPSWQGIGRDWGNLNVAYPCRALAVDHPRAVALAHRYWATTGGPGLGYYGRVDSLHTYIAADLATWALLAGRRGAADSVLDQTLLWRSASGGAAEMFSGPAREYGGNLPPHGASAAALLMMVRNALVYDDGDTLHLTLGARTAWWRNGAASGAPTRWGTIDLQFRHGGDVVFWKWKSIPVWTALHLPPGTALAEDPPSPLRAGPSGDVVLAPPGVDKVTVHVRQESR